MSWGWIARRTGKRVRLIVDERHREPSSERWIVRRNNDGRTWAGAYRWNGQTFTVKQNLWYLYTNEVSAIAAIDNNNLVGVSVIQLPLHEVRQR